MAIKLRTKIDRNEIRRLGFAIKNIPNFATESDARKVGDEVVKEMKDLVGKGISPIEGKGRFPGYLHANEKGKYPASAPKRFRKGSRPVNLKLSGDMMDDLERNTYKADHGYGVNIEYGSQLSQKKEQGHREGKNGQPSRPTLPQGNERFAQTIQQRIVDYFKKVLAVRLKKL
ncbi:MAG: hypothetical protein HOO67_03370 [Candidatus Peribacteraceae bacterium]|nr:hypothetical protein [Candidatus Peribacteraceae bacterium]